MYYRALACFCLFSASAVIFSSSTPRQKQRTLFLYYFFFSSTNRNRILPFKSFALWMPLKTSPFCSIWTLLSFISFTATSRVPSMNLLQSGFPLNTCSRGISDGQHVFSKPLFPSTSIIAVSIRSFTEKSACASSFSKVALEASFFFVFFFVFGLLSIMNHRQCWNTQNPRIIIIAPFLVVVFPQMNHTDWRQREEHKERKTKEEKRERDTTVCRICVRVCVLCVLGIGVYFLLCCVCL